MHARHEQLHTALRITNKELIFNTFINFKTKTIMRKITLLFASLLLSLGAWAQEAKTPVLIYEDITTVPQELSADDAATIRAMQGMTIVADVEISNSNNVSLLFTAVADYTSASDQANAIWGFGFGSNNMRFFEKAVSGGWYSRGSVNTTAKKIIYTYDGTTFKFYVDGAHVGDVGLARSLASFDGQNAKFYLGGMLCNTTTEYGKFNGTINKVEIYNSVLTDAEIFNMCVTLPEGFVADPSAFENGKVYTFVTQRGWMGAKDDNNNAISTAYANNNATGSKDDANYQWTVYKSENNHYYLYNVGKGMFLGEQSANNTAIPFVATPAGKQLSFKTSSNALYPIMISTDNAAVVNHSTSYAPGLISWTGGWNTLTDDGSNHQVVAIGELDATTYANIKTLVAAYELDNTEAVAELDAAITKANAMAQYIGTGVGKYSTTDADYATKFAAIVAFREAIVTTNTPTPAEVEAKTAEVEAIIASFQLNMPEAGKYYTFNNDGFYITGSTTDAGRIALSENNDIDAIYYFDGSHLLSYNTNLYMGLNATDWTFEAEGSTDISEVYFVASTAVAGAYNINCGTRWLHKGDGFVNRCSANTCGAAHAWVIEEVTDLPDKEGEGEETGINTVGVQETAIIYDLTGRRVEKIQKGIYIVNGKKVVIK